MDYTNLKKFVYGSISGFTNTILFSPYDRALYLSIKHNISFLRKRNWTNPYQGLSQSFFHRFSSYGFYYPIVDICGNNLSFISSKPKRTILASGITSCIVGMITTPLEAIKMTNWNGEKNKNSFTLIKNMYTTSGVFPFLRCIHITLSRDILFGSIYGALSMNFNENKKFINDVIYACIATTLTSPLTYYKKICYQSDMFGNPTLYNTFYKLNIDANKRYCNNIYIKLYYILHERFCIGWSTLKVGLSISISRQIYIYFNDSINV